MSDGWSSGNTPGSGEQFPYAAAEAQEAHAAATQASASEAGASASGFGAAGSAAYRTGAASAAGAPSAGNWGPVTGGYAATAPPPPPAGVVGSPSDPNPLAAFWLGLIPGVGAMYNGQVAKGFVHLIVFFVLVVMANNISGVFGLFVMGWIFFMAFEAYHTAKARREGLPLPNAFGWNDIGERMGLGKNWPFSPAAPVTGAATAPGTRPGTGSGAQAAAGGPSTGPAPGGWTGVPPAYAPPPYPVPPAGVTGYGVGPNWAGYVPPSAFAGTPPIGPAGTEPVAGGPGGAGPPGHGVPYAPVNAGSSYAGPPLGAPSIADVPPAASRLPVGAIWLIGLGVLFLLGQWTPLLEFSRIWIPSVLLTALAAFIFARRMGWMGASAWRPAATLPIGVRVASAVRVPGILVTIAILNGLHEAWVVRWHYSWPWLLIAVGVLMLVERVALRQAVELGSGTDAARKGGL